MRALDSEERDAKGLPILAAVVNFARLPLEGVFMVVAHPWDREPDEDTFEASELVCLMRNHHNGV
jgi:hypothetical protein